MMSEAKRPVVDPSADSGVWLGMAQTELDRAYDQSQWAPTMAQLLQRFAEASEAARSRIGAPWRLRYGAAEVEALDFFDCGRADAPVVVFLHGGAWRSGLARDYAFVAEVFVGAGIHVALPDFAWVQDCSGDLRVPVDQTRRAIAWVHAQAAPLGIDPGRLFLIGHSSGAHLAAVAATTGCSKTTQRHDLIRGSVLCSGCYELEPVRRSSRSRYLEIDDAAAHDLSPLRHVDRLRHPLVVAWGTHESPEFQRHGRELAAAAKAHVPVRTVVAQGLNHFEILQTLAVPDGLVGRASLELILGD